MSRQNQIAVIFTAQRTLDDQEGYAAAAEQMRALAVQQPGYKGVNSSRDAKGLGITISYWADEASAKKWRDHPDHKRIRDLGRDRWYSHYSLEVATISRSYTWQK
jgi:heme-degrading monooxygenase HmoA